MEWYYAVNNQRLGPVSAAEFSRLVTTGEIRPETLVWREGMTAWQPFREVPAEAPAEAPSPAAVCAECGAIFSVDELLELDGRRICARCKPSYLQRVREGVVENPTEEGALAERPLILPEIVARSWAIWVRHLGVIALLTLISAIPTNLILDALPMSDQPSLREAGRMIRVTLLLEILLGSFSIMGIAFVVGEAVAGRDPAIGAVLQHAARRWLSAIGTGFLENLIVGFLFLLLIVPGVIWMGYYTFVMYVVALRERGGLEALRYSKDLVRGRWWRVVGYVFALLGMTLFPMFAVQALSPATSGPIWVAISAVTDVIMSFLSVSIGVFFLNLDALRRAGRL